MALTINNNSDWDHEITTWSRSQMIVQFTDKTEVDAGESAPTHWLWNFGDGHYSRAQNPIHIFRGRFNQPDQEFTSATHNVEYTVILTTWAGGSYKNDLFYRPLVGERFRGISDQWYDTHAEAQSAQKVKLPLETWTYLAIGNPQYQIAKPVTWNYQCQLTDLKINLSAHSVDTFVGYTEFGINTFWWGSRNYGNGLGGDSGIPYCLRFGKWNATANTWATRDGDDPLRPNEYDVMHTKWLTASPIVDYAGLDISPFAGIKGIQYFRCCDGYEYTKDLQPYGLSGYVLYLSPMSVEIWQDITPKNKGVTSKQLIPNELVISRPAILYSGIREAYFSDGWEDRKHLYLEVSKANPCTIQFFDLYVNTTNE